MSQPDRVEPLHRHRGSVWPVEGNHYRVDDSGCWVWFGYIDHQGYGHISGPSVHGERRAHRAAYAAAHGPVPKGDHIHHRCEIKACINPAHLEHHTASTHRQLHKQGDSSLTWDDVRTIRRANKDGRPQQEIREWFGIAQPTLSDIIMNVTWVDPDYKPGRLVVCALRECGEVFETTRSNKRFCCASHRGMHNSRTPGGYVDRRLDREAA